MAKTKIMKQSPSKQKLAPSATARAGSHGFSTQTSQIHSARRFFDSSNFAATKNLKSFHLQQKLEASKPQSLMMAAAPIKSRSKRIYYHSRLNTGTGGPSSPTHFGGQQVNSNETLHRGGPGGANHHLVGVRSNSFKTLKQVGSVRINASQNSCGSATGKNGGANGLTERNVRHNIDRDCHWEHPPHI